jgi:hypothetical protein
VGSVLSVFGACYSYFSSVFSVVMDSHVERINVKAINGIIAASICNFILYYQHSVIPEFLSFFMKYFSSKHKHFHVSKLTEYATAELWQTRIMCMQSSGQLLHQ